MHRLTVPAGGEATVDLRLRLGRRAARSTAGRSAGVRRRPRAARATEADEFYAAITPAGLDEDAAMVMRQALAGMLWSKQWYGFDVDTWLTSATPIRCVRAVARVAQLAVVPHAQRRRHLDARQVGVPVVRGVGPRVPLRPADDGRPGRSREAAARADAQRRLPAPERPDPRLRVELRRREPAGPRLGDALRLHARDAAARARATSTSSRRASRSCC